MKLCAGKRPKSVHMNAPTELTSIKLLNGASFSSCGRLPIRGNANGPGGNLWLFFRPNHSNAKIIPATASVAERSMFLVVMPPQLTLTNLSCSLCVWCFETDDTEFIFNRVGKTCALGNRRCPVCLSAPSPVYRQTDWQTDR